MEIKYSHIVSRLKYEVLKVCMNLSNSRTNFAEMHDRADIILTTLWKFLGHESQSLVRQHLRSRPQQKFLKWSHQPRQKMKKKTKQKMKEEIS